jgi:hypothetical protein
MLKKYFYIHRIQLIQWLCNKETNCINVNNRNQNFKDTSPKGRKPHYFYSGTPGWTLISTIYSSMNCSNLWIASPFRYTGHTGSIPGTVSRTVCSIHYLIRLGSNAYKEIISNWKWWKCMPSNINLHSYAFFYIFQVGITLIYTIFVS